MTFLTSLFENYSLIHAFSGGMLIGVSATLLLLFKGRIAGISGILSGVFFAPQNDKLWRVFFLAGLVLGAAGLHFFAPEFYFPRFDYPVPLLGLGGFLVGFGTRMGSGCTSGHAVCGIPRFSKRSIFATLSFMSTAMITVFMLRYVLGITS